MKIRIIWEIDFRTPGTLALSMWPKSFRRINRPRGKGGRYKRKEPDNQLKLLDEKKDRE